MEGQVEEKEEEKSRRISMFSLVDTLKAVMFYVVSKQYTISRHMGCTMPIFMISFAHMLPMV